MVSQGMCVDTQSSFLTHLKIDGENAIAQIIPHKTTTNIVQSRQDHEFQYVSTKQVVHKINCDGY